MNREAREQMSHGVEQLTAPESSLWERTKGVGNVALGGMGYTFSPVNAGLRTVVGTPIEQTTGIPKEYPEFIAGMALPGGGITRTEQFASRAAPTTDALFKAAEAAYKSPEVAALKLHPQTMAIFGDEAIAALEREGHDPLLAEKTFGLLEKAMKVPEGAQYVTANNFQTLRRKLGMAAKSSDPTERLVARAAMEKLDNFMANIPSNAVLEGDAGVASAKLADARGNYAAAMRSERLQDAVTYAEDRAASAGIGGNLENTTRQEVRKILNTPAKSRGLSDEEVSALRDYERGNFTRNSLRVATKILGGDNPLMAAIHAGLAWPTSGLSLAAPLTGYALKKINNAVSERQLGSLDELLRSRSPLAAQTRAAVINWSREAGRLELDPGAKSAARVAATAKLLADKFRSGGIDIDLGKMVGPLQGPGTGRADEGKPDVPRPPGQQKYGGAVPSQYAHGGNVSIGHKHIPSREQRVVGRTYRTPKGPMVWKGEGWKPHA
jgi:hypothetical protein